MEFQLEMGHDPLFYEGDSIICYEIIYDTVFVEVFDTIPVFDSISVTDTLIIDVTFTGLNPPDNKNTIKVYPNPTKDIVFIHMGYNYAKMADYKIKLINTQGQAIFESNISQQLIEIDIGAFGQTGLYIIQIIDETSQIIETRKIILE